MHLALKVHLCLSVCLIGHFFGPGPARLAPLPCWQEPRLQGVERFRGPVLFTAAD